MVKTKDGEHYYFRTVCSAPSLVRPDGIELKGAGSYVVIPPSPDKEWLRQAHDCPIASAPEWLTATPPRTKAEVIPVWRQPMTGETSLLQGPVLDPPGNRHNSLLNWAGRYAYRGWTSKAHALLLINSAIRAGLEHDDALRLIDFAFRT